MAAARDLGERELGLTPAAQRIWKAWYEAPPDVDGLLDAATARREPYVLRLALIYALLDQSGAIDDCHLQAAVAFWDYAFASARYLFGERLGNATADRILRGLRDRHPDEMDRTQIHELFSKSLPPGKLDAACETLERRGFARRRKEQTSGRPRELWQALPLPKKPKEGGKRHRPSADDEVSSDISVSSNAESKANDESKPAPAEEWGGSVKTDADVDRLFNYARQRIPAAEDAA